MTEISAAFRSWLCYSGSLSALGSALLSPSSPYSPWHEEGMVTLLIMFTHSLTHCAFTSISDWHDCHYYLAWHDFTCMGTAMTCMAGVSPSHGWIVPGPWLLYLAAHSACLHSVIVYRSERDLFAWRFLINSVLFSQVLATLLSCTSNC